MDIDPNANTATLPKPSRRTLGREGSDRPRRRGRGRRRSAAGGSREAMRATSSRRRARRYQDAVDNPGEGDVTRVGNVGGGTRPVFSETYTARLAELEAAVKSAEEELKRARGRLALAAARPAARCCAAPAAVAQTLYKLDR